MAEDRFQQTNRFPIAWIAAVMSSSCGAILNLRICRHAGNGQGEVSLLGDVLLADNLLSNWTEMVLVKQHGADTVSRL
jgi:hypothetical protein